MSEAIYRRSWRKTAARAHAVLGATPAPLTLPEQWAVVQSAWQGARAAIVQLWEDAPAEYAAGNLDAVSASTWSAAFAAEAAAIDGAWATLMAAAGAG